MTEGATKIDIANHRVRIIQQCKNLLFTTQTIFTNAINLAFANYKRPTFANIQFSDGESISARKGDKNAFFLIWSNFF